MLKVFKYEITAKAHQSIRMPRGTQILTVQMQHGKPQLWALVNPENDDYEGRYFRLAGTGHPIHERNLVVEGNRGSDTTYAYVGSFQTHEGDFIYHLFEEYGWPMEEEDD